LITTDEIRLKLNELRRRIGRPFFYQGEVLDIAAISADTLLTWHKRGLIPEPAANQGGKGHRRLYSVADAFYLAILKKLVDAHYPLSDANALADKLRPKLIAWAFLQASDERIVALYPPDQIEGISGSSDPAIAAWMEHRKLDVVTFLDLKEFATQVHQRYIRVLEEKRNSPARGRALAELVRSELQRD
jgi:DNA-binding transcriptional MerR regulator